MAATARSKPADTAGRATGAATAMPRAAGVPRISVVLIAGIGLLALDALHGHLLRTKFVEKMQPFMDPANTSVRTRFTGIARLDELLSVLVVLFLPVSSGEMPELTLFTAQFGGQLVAFITLIIINGQRQENAWRVTSLSTLWLLGMQAVGFAVLVPAYFIIDLVLTSSTPYALTLRDPLQLKAIVPAFILAYMIPSAMHMVPCDDYLHQTLIALWQPFPIYLSTLLYVFSQVAKRASPSGGIPGGKAAADRDAVNHAYGFAIWTAAVSHWLVIGTIVAVGINPDILSADVAERLTFANVFVPRPIHYYGDAHPAGFNEISMQFLQLDNYTGSLSCLVWAATKAARAGAWEFNASGILSLVKDVVVLGPISASLSLLQTRDEHIYASQYK